MNKNYESKIECVYYYYWQTPWITDNFWQLTDNLLTTSAQSTDKWKEG